MFKVWQSFLNDQTPIMDIFTSICQYWILSKLCRFSFSKRTGEIEDIILLVFLHTHAGTDDGSWRVYDCIRFILECIIYIGIINLLNRDLSQQNVDVFSNLWTYKVIFRECVHVPTNILVLLQGLDQWAIYILCISGVRTSWSV